MVPTFREEQLQTLVPMFREEQLQTLKTEPQPSVCVKSTAQRTQLARSLHTFASPQP